jgi:DNA-binding transcriptional MerR regulator
MPGVGMNSTRDGYSSGELARLVGVSSDTLRHYERKGVLGRVQRLANGYRRYPPESLDRLRVVRAALALGFTLDELADIFAVRGRGGVPCRAARKLAAEKLAEAEGRLEDLVALVESLRALLDEWDERLATLPAGAPARLLESLGTRSALSGKRRKTRIRRRTNR